MQRAERRAVLRCNRTVGPERHTLESERRHGQLNGCRLHPFGLFDQLRSMPVVVGRGDGMITGRFRPLHLVTV
jgi:hypothetical protein